MDTSSPEEEDARRSLMLRGFLWNALIDGLGSYLVYMFLRWHGTEFHALAWSMLPPALNNLWSLARKRHLDITGVIVIAGLVLGLGLVLLGGSPRLLLVRDSFITGAFGLVFLGSLLFRRPLLFYISQQLSAGTDPVLRAEWDARYEESPSHLGLSLITGVWGVILVAEAGLRTIIALTIPIPVFMAVWPFINLGMFGLASLWTFLYGRRLQEREESASEAQ
jgi:hypothetical protein